MKRLLITVALAAVLVPTIAVAQDSPNIGPEVPFSDYGLVQNWATAGTDTIWATKFQAGCTVPFDGGTAETRAWFGDTLVRVGQNNDGSLKVARRSAFAFKLYSGAGFTYQAWYPNGEKSGVVNVDTTQYHGLVVGAGTLGVQQCCVAWVIGADSLIVAEAGSDSVRVEAYFPAE